MAEGKINEHILIWNSAYRDNWQHNTASCAVGYPMHHWLSDTLSFAVKSVTLTNLFPNIYGQSAILYFRDVGEPDTLLSCVVPTQNVETTAELVSLLQACLDSVLGAGFVTVSLTADGYIRIGNDAGNVSFLTQQEIHTITGFRTSLNLIMGMNSSMVLKDTTGGNLDLVDRPNLTGVRKVRVSTTMGASSNSIMPSGDVGDVITSLSLHDVDFGFSKTYEYDLSHNARHVFEGNRDCSRVDVFLHDEYDQVLELPENAPMDVEFTVTSRTT